MKLFYKRNILRIHELVLLITMMIKYEEKVFVYLFGNDGFSEIIC